jgi:hypothetical protein
MVLSGFSGRATRLLARTLAHRAEDFWPPVFHENYLQVGAFIVKYDATDMVDESNDILSTDLMANATVIPLSAEVFARRLGKGNA